MQRVNSAQKNQFCSLWTPYIIDFSSFDAAFELVREIRKKNHKHFPIAALSELHLDESRSAKLQQKEFVDYVLHRPIHPQQIDNLLSDLCKHCSEKPTAASNKLQEIKRHIR